MSIRVSSLVEAWEMVNLLSPYEFEYDKVRSYAAGYSVYSAVDGPANVWVSNLGDRLEVNGSGKTENVWFGDDKTSVITEDILLNYLRGMMKDFKKYEEKFGLGDRIVDHKLDSMIACKELVEAVIMKPVNLKVDGTVTVGLD